MHGFGTGSDANGAWLQVLSVVCVALVLAAILARAIAGWPENVGVRSAALAATGGVRRCPRAVAAQRALAAGMGAALGHTRVAAAPLAQPPQTPSGSRR